jgi:hypothetical protein
VRRGADAVRYGLQGLIIIIIAQAKQTKHTNNTQVTYVQYIAAKERVQAIDLQQLTSRGGTMPLLDRPPYRILHASAKVDIVNTSPAQLI